MVFKQFTPAEKAAYAKKQGGKKSFSKSPAKKSFGKSKFPTKGKKPFNSFNKY